MHEELVELRPLSHGFKTENEMTMVQFVFLCLHMSLNDDVPMSICQG